MTDVIRPTRQPAIYLLFDSPHLPQQSDEDIKDAINAIEPLSTPVEISWFLRKTDQFLGQIQFNNHKILLSFASEPLPLYVSDRTIHTSQWNPQIKAHLRRHQSFLNIVYTGSHHDPIEKMIALYKVAHALQNEDLLGIANENAWTAHPLVDSLNPEKILAYRKNIPFALWIGSLKIFIDPDHYWISTKGHHIFDVPDLAYFVQPGDQPDQIVNTFANIFYYLYENDTEVVAGDTLSIAGTGETMRFSEVTEFEDFLMGPAGTLVVEKILPDQV